MLASLRSGRLIVAGLVVVAVACGNDDLRADPASVDTVAADAAMTVNGEVVVFAAASLTAAFTELGDEFIEQHPDASVTFSFAGSSELVAQIIEGAPADVYASADLASMVRLTDAAAEASDPVVFATNVAEIVVAPGNPLEIAGVEDLAGDDLIVVTCSPEVPCGSYASRIFDHAGVSVVPDSFERNVNAVVAKVVLGEADAGIVYATDVAAAGADADGVEIPTEFNVIAEYPIVLTTETTNPSGGRAFIDLVLSDVGQAILSSHGFGAP